MSDTSHDIGVYQDTVTPGLCVTEYSYANVASMALLTNRNGASLSTADILTLSTANASSVLAPSTSGPYRPALAVPYDIDLDGNEAAKTIASLVPGWIYKPGAFVPHAAVDGAVDRGEYLTYSATAKKFSGTNAFTCRPLTAQAIALETIATAGNIPVLLLSPSPQLCRRARVYNSIDIATAAGVMKTVTFDSETYDNAGLHSISSNTSRLTIPAGTPTQTYRITGSIAYAAAGANQVDIRKGGGDVFARQFNASGANTLFTTVSVLMQLAAGEYVELEVTTAAIATIKYYAGYSPVFTIAQVGE